MKPTDQKHNDLLSLTNSAAALGYDSVQDYLHDLIRASGRTPKASHDLSTIPTPVKWASKGSGTIYHGDSRALMNSVIPPSSVDLIMTSPPFGLVRKKPYGNEDADDYLEWFRPFAEGFHRVLKPSGSLVIDIGGAWKKGLPVRSLYHFELLSLLCREFGFHLCQEFYWWNPSKLPSPAEWVTIRRIRLKDAVNSVYWLSKSPWPKANNRRVLAPYSKSMHGLLKNGYQPKRRPSGHDISDQFGNDNKGSIAPNLLAIPNTESNGTYQAYCREHNVPIHPARFPRLLPEFFLRLLSDPGDLVLDPFAGSCVTGEVAERMERKWICCELDEKYLKGARGRFKGQQPPSVRPLPRYEIAPPCSIDVFANERLTTGKSRPPRRPRAK